MLTTHELKFTYMQLLRETAIPGDDETKATEEKANVHDAYLTVIVRVSQLTELVKMLLCPTWRCATLSVRAVNCSLGLVCKLETYCATCEDIVSSLSAMRAVNCSLGLVCKLETYCATCEDIVSSLSAMRAVNCSLGLVCKLETYCATCEDIVSSLSAMRAVNCSLGLVCKLETYCSTCEDIVSSLSAMRAVNCSLGLVCKLETYCATCEDRVSTLTSDHIGGTAGNLHFVVTHSVVSASMDVGHSGIVKLCRYLDMNSITHTTYATHRSAVTDASKETACNILDNAAKVVRCMYVEADPSLADAELIDLTVSYDGSWVKRGHNLAYGIGCVIDTVTGLVLDLTMTVLLRQ